MALDFTGKSWAHKTVNKFTDAEILDAMKTYEAALPDANEGVYASLWREWERRHGLAEAEY
jgi:hypothetical protein